MRGRFIASMGLLAILLAVVSWAAVSMAGQNASQTRPVTAAPQPAAAAPKPVAAAPKPAAATQTSDTLKAGPAPRTPWGTPDLQGVWFVLTSVPLERTPANANKEFLTDEEVAALDKGKEVSPGRNARNANGAQDVEGAYNAVFNSILKTGKRTSMIIDPPDGRIPARVGAAPQGRGGRGGGAAPGAAAPAGQAAGAAVPAAVAALGGVAPAGAAANAAGGGGGRGGGGGGGRGAGAGGRGGGSPNDNPETLLQSPRCLGVELAFLPLNTAFAQGTVMQLVQSPKSLGMYMEDDHAGGGNRVIIIDSKPHLTSSVKTYLGDSRAHWMGNSLIVETTNVAHPSVNRVNANPDTFKMTERFTRVDSNNLKREITFEDPQTWTRPWTVLIEMGKTDDRRHMIFDSACHEGNYGMVGVLAGARKEEQAAKK
jgi:hypothetical protein